MLPRLQGTAGEFVFGQLQRSTRGNYETLMSELNSRFRVVETKKTFGAQFSKRNQKVSESAEEYVAELKRLYDKAYSQRDSETRQEDLLRFLDSLYDDKARFQVEYVKEPKTIDEAAFYVVDFEETRRRPSSYEGNERKNKRQVRNVNFSDMESGISETENEQQNFRNYRKPIRKTNNIGGQMVTKMEIRIRVDHKEIVPSREIVPYKENVPYKEIVPSNRGQMGAWLQLRPQTQVRWRTGCLNFCRKYQNLKMKQIAHIRPHRQVHGLIDRWNMCNVTVVLILGIIVESKVNN